MKREPRNIREFLQDTRYDNLWIDFKDIRVYVRKGRRNPGGPVTDLQISSVGAKEVGQGAWKRFWQCEIVGNINCLPQEIYIENVLNERFRQWFLRPPFVPVANNRRGQPWCFTIQWFEVLQAASRSNAASVPVLALETAEEEPVALAADTVPEQSGRSIFQWEDSMESSQSSNNWFGGVVEGVMALGLVVTAGIVAGSSVYGATIISAVVVALTIMVIGPTSEEKARLWLNGLKIWAVAVIAFQALGLAIETNIPASIKWTAYTDIFIWFSLLPACVIMCSASLGAWWAHMRAKTEANG